MSNSTTRLTTRLINPLFHFSNCVLSESHGRCASYNHTFLKNIIRDVNEIVNPVEHRKWVFQCQCRVDGVEVYFMLVHFVLKLLVQQLSKLWVNNDYVFHITNIRKLIHTNKQFVTNLCKFFSRTLVKQVFVLFRDIFHHQFMNRIVVDVIVQMTQEK